MIDAFVPTSDAFSIFQDFQAEAQHGLNRKETLEFKGPFTKDVRLKPGFLDPPSPCVRIKQ